MPSLKASLPLEKGCGAPYHRVEASVAFLKSFSIFNIFLLFNVVGVSVIFSSVFLRSGLTGVKYRGQCPVPYRMRYSIGTIKRHIMLT